MQIITYKTLISPKYYKKLDELALASSIVVQKMLLDKTKTSSKFYKEVPCVVAKSLSAKYQRNPLCKTISKLCIPICGDKGKQVKLVEGGIRIPAIFKKEIIPCQFLLPISGFIRQVEFLKREGDWYMSYTCNTPCAAPIDPIGVIGVDRNSVGNIVTLANPNMGKVRFLGFNADKWKFNFRRRKAKIMSQGRKRLASRLRRKQSRRTRNENHRVSKGIVDYAARQNCALALENLKLNKKAKRYADTRQWAHAQLLNFIQYKAALRGVPVVFVNPAFTSQDCSLCGQRNKTEGKKYSCSFCGHKDHRDANAAFNIAKRGFAGIVGIDTSQASLCRAVLTLPNLGNEVIK